MVSASRRTRSRLFSALAVLAPIALAASLPAASGCDKTDPTAFRPKVAPEAGTGEVGPSEVTFPPGFLFGSATSAFQIEKGNARTDWGWWVALGRAKNRETPDVGGPDALRHIDEDIRLLWDTGQNAYRFSIEWGRIYPTRASFDDDLPEAAAIAAYDSLLTKLRAAKMTPMVTLQHFSLPDYLSDPREPQSPQGWERPETEALFAEFARRMAARFGDKVDWWVTINEPLVVAVTGYVASMAPPGLILRTGGARDMVRAAARAHARAYDAIHQADTVDADGDGEAAMVSIAAHQRTFHPLDPSEPDDVVATERVRYIWNLWFLNAIVRGDWDEDMDGKFDGPGDKRAAPELAGRADYLGINYYSDTLISSRPGPIIPIVGATVKQEHLPTDRPKTDVGWDIYPEGLRAVLEEARDYGVPLVVTENGIADASDKNRGRYIAEHLYQVGWARANGVDVRGYFHWSLMDNFEWSLGYCLKFGLAAVDNRSAERTLRPSAETYKAIIQANKVRREDLDAFPPYGPAAFCH